MLNIKKPDGRIDPDGRKSSPEDTPACTGKKEMADEAR
jgi:hypothetical protein